MNGREFIAKVREMGRARGIPVRVDTERGKGNHTLYYGDRLAIVRDPRKDLKTGLLSAMIRQLGLNRNDLR